MKILCDKNQPEVFRSAKDLDKSPPSPGMDVCQRLIHISFDKIFSIKKRRGADSLHRSMLVMRVLKKAREEQSRLSTDSDTSDHQQQLSPKEDIKEVFQYYGLDGSPVAKSKNDQDDDKDDKSDFELPPTLLKYDDAADDEDDCLDDRLEIKIDFSDDDSEDDDENDDLEWAEEAEESIHERGGDYSSLDPHNSSFIVTRSRSRSKSGLSSDSESPSPPKTTGTTLLLGSAHFEATKDCEDDSNHDQSPDTENNSSPEFLLLPLAKAVSPKKRTHSESQKELENWSELQPITKRCRSMASITGIESARPGSRNGELAGLISVFTSGMAIDNENEHQQFELTCET